ncbi:hypothetical protein FW774_16610 [Pedobacter sp. BS3]|uniref:hypothetical protein n=1 Tax=Pedobacter sp. BS3 TaxID=2567937 RepID=UPI0011EDFBB4|nr:hypothetical protein [Pedobacter sp. BS3]TZF82305.1 hypothetical protein FW774_16610 [Pedobacter sp. BS3]
MMKLLLNIQDSEATAFLKLIEDNPYVKAEHITAPDMELLAEIKEIKTAFKHVKRIKEGKLKTRPVEDLLNEL